MSIVIGSARIDENGKASGGAVGDQTGKEVSTQNFYVSSKGWYILRPKNVAHANAMARLMKQACDNNNLGYDQSNRLGVIKYGINTKTKTECDCSSLVRACIKEATGKDPGNFTTYNEVSVLVATGLFNEKVAYVSQSKTPIYNGDVLVTKTKGHTVIVVSGNPRNSSSSTSTSPSSSSSASTSSNKIIIKNGQQHAVDFTGIKIEVDGVVGTETNKMKSRVLQHAMNLDYGKTIEEDGEFGTKSKSKLGSHYVEKGEKQYMVTAAEILMMLNGIDPKGVEKPGIYDNGLVAAAKTKFGDDGLKITASEFMKLI